MNDEKEWSVEIVDSRNRKAIHKSGLVMRVHDLYSFKKVEIVTMPTKPIKNWNPEKFKEEVYYRYRNGTGWGP